MKMEKRLNIFFFIWLQQICDSSSGNFQLCDASTRIKPSCSVQIWSRQKFDDASNCDVGNIPADSSECKDSFSELPLISSSSLGDISLKPFLAHLVCPNYTTYSAVPNIVFRDIKWKRLKFRIQKLGSVHTSRHCRSLAMPDTRSTASIDEQPVLYYDCYRSLVDGNYRGLVHVLDVEATDGDSIDGRQFLFYIPAAQMIKPTENQIEWKPFIYIENLVTSIKLRILPPPTQMNFTYHVQVLKSYSNKNLVANFTLESHNSINEVTYDYTPTADGIYCFEVTTIHDRCKNGYVECKSVSSPPVPFSAPSKNLLFFGFCIFGAAIALSLIIYVVNRRYCKRPTGVPEPTKVLVIYSPANSIHAGCVASCVDYLQSEYGFDIYYDRDIKDTTHCDPYFWAENVVREATIIMYIVGPKDNGECPNSAHPNIDKLLLSFLKAVRAIQPKDVINVFFEHSNGPVPIETRNDKCFYLLKDWQKLIAYLSRDLLPKKQIMRTHRGKCFIENLTRVKTLLDVA